MPTVRGARLATQRRDLESFVEFDLIANRAGFIGYQVLPMLDVSYQADNFGRIPQDQLARLAEVERTSQGGYNRIHWTFEDDSYQTREYGLEGPIDRRNARIYREVVDAYRATTAIVTHNILARAELRVAAEMAAAAFNSTAVGTSWLPANAATNTPITDVKDASQRVRDAMGQYANAAIMTRFEFRNCQESDQVHQRIHAMGAGGPIKPTDITKELLAQCFDVEKVIVADSCYDDSPEDADGSGANLVDIWERGTIYVCKLAKTQSIEESCVGRTFHWTGDGSTANGTVETYYEEKVRGDVVRVRHETDEKIIYPVCGEKLTGAAA